MPVYADTGSLAATGFNVEASVFSRIMTLVDLFIGACSHANAKSKKGRSMWRKSFFNVSLCLFKDSEER